MPKLYENDREHNIANKCIEAKYNIKINSLTKFGDKGTLKDDLEYVFKSLSSKIEVSLYWFNSPISCSTTHCAIV